MKIRNNQLAVPVGTIAMSASESRKIHRDYKTLLNGQRHVLRCVNGCTRLLPVTIAKEARQ